MDYNLVTYCSLTLLFLYAAAVNLGEPPIPSADGCQVAYVYDGDTVEMICGEVRSTARLIGFDTPETKSPGCAAELALGKQATERLRTLLRGQTPELRKFGYDKFGRDLVSLRVGGRDVGEVLIEEGLALAYHGGTRANWCTRLGKEWGF